MDPKPYVPKPRTQRGFAKLAKARQRPNLPAPRSAIRIIDHALRDAGWSVTNRREIVKAVKSGRGDMPFMHSEAVSGGLTEKPASPNSVVTYAQRCEFQGSNPDANWTNGTPSAAAPIDE